MCSLSYCAKFLYSFICMLCKIYLFPCMFCKIYILHCVIELFISSHVVQNLYILFLLHAVWIYEVNFFVCYAKLYILLHGVRILQYSICSPACCGKYLLFPLHVSRNIYILQYCMLYIFASYFLSLSCEMTYRYVWRNIKILSFSSFRFILWILWVLDAYWWRCWLWW